MRPATERREPNEDVLCALGAIRTRDLPLRRRLLYPLSYKGGVAEKPGRASLLPEAPVQSLDLGLRPVPLRSGPGRARVPVPNPADRRDGAQAYRLELKLRTRIAVAVAAAVPDSAPAARHGPVAAQNK